MNTSIFGVAGLSGLTLALIVTTGYAQNSTDLTGEDFSVEELVAALDIPVRGIDADCTANQQKMDQLTRGISVNPVSAQDVPALKPMKTASVSATFEINSAELTGDATSKLDRIATAMKTPELAAQCFQVAGHTCDLGDDTYNLELSRRRAESVKIYLVGQGIEPDRIVTTGYGETSPLATGQTELDRQKNRRVDLGALPPVALEYQ